MRPDRQRRGVGSALVHALLDACARASQQAVFVVGNPAYYGRFGFRPASPLGFSYPAAPEPALQVIELVPGALAGCAGRVEYLPPFDEM